MGVGWGYVNVHVNGAAHANASSRQGVVVGVVGDVNVHVNLRHMRMLRHVIGLGLGWAVSSFWHHISRTCCCMFPYFFTP